jgi:flavin-dependent dehydrogenase
MRSAFSRRAGGQAYDTADVVVIGGGPAGATAAALLASWGRRVTMLVRPGPRRSLAESLPPSCGKLLDRAGLRRAVDEAGFVRSTGNTVWWGGSGPRVERFGGTQGYQVPRSAFDRLLVAAAEAAGARVRRRATACEVVRAAGGESPLSEVHFERAGRRDAVRARWVLDCTGRAGLLARRGWRRPGAGGRTLAIVGTWDRRGGWGLADETHTLVESYDDGWVWSVPVSAARRYVTVMVDPALTSVAGRAQLAATYDAELAKAPHLHDLVRHARRGAELWARDASSYSAERIGDDGLLLVGDAASFVDPLSSYGVKKGMASAWLAAVVVHTCLSKPERVAPALELFEARERAMYESLRRRLAQLSREAAGAHAAGFWHGRDDVDDVSAPDGEPDVVALRSDPDVLAAFDELKRRPSMHLRPTRAVSRVRKPVVRGNTVVLEEHLVVPALRDGVRYLRSVDLVTLADLAPAHDDVPALYDAYNRAAPPAPLPDFLGALSVLVGKRVLDFA